MAAKSRRDPIAELYGLISTQAKKLTAPPSPPPIPVPLAPKIANHVISESAKGLPYHTWFPIDVKRHNRTLTMFHAHDPSKTITLQCVEPPGHKGGCHYENPSNKKRTR